MRGKSRVDKGVFGVEQLVRGAAFAQHGVEQHDRLAAHGLHERGVDACKLRGVWHVLLYAVDAKPLRGKAVRERRTSRVAQHAVNLARALGRSQERT